MYGKGSKKSSSYQLKRKPKLPTHVGAKKPKLVEPKTAKTPKLYYPKSVKTPEDKKIFELFRLRAGDWTQDFLSSAAGRMLTDSHWEKALPLLQKAKIKTKADAEKLMEKIMKLPEQRFLLLHEASARGPLTTEAFKEYFSLFQTLFPQFYKQIYGNKTPSQITSTCKRQMDAMGMKM